MFLLKQNSRTGIAPPPWSSSAVTSCSVYSRQTRHGNFQKQPPCYWFWTNKVNHYAWKKLLMTQWDIDQTGVVLQEFVSLVKGCMNKQFSHQDNARASRTVTISVWHQCLFGKITVLVYVSFSGMTIPDEDTEAGQTSKYCLVAIGRLQVCMPTLNAWISDILYMATKTWVLSTN